jgi:hypothetical protein
MLHWRHPREKHGRQSPFDDAAGTAFQPLAAPRADNNEDDAMNHAALMLAALMSLTTVSEAAAWSRNRTVTTPHGTSSFAASGTCASGTCSRSAVRTGPRGNSLSANSTVTCDASRENCARTKTYNRSNGGTVIVEGSIHR